MYSSCAFVLALCVAIAASLNSEQSNDIGDDDVPREINLSSRNLTALPTVHDINPLVKVLNMSMNRIANATDELRSFTRLEVLILRFNNFTHLRFLPEPCGLRRLDASRNNISSLEGPLATCSLLESLNLTANNLKSLPDGVFSNMNRLKVLYLAGNGLTNLPQGVFRGLRNLERLRLNGNRLREVRRDLFHGLNELRYLDFSLNNLTSLPLLEDCCKWLQGAYFKNNSIVEASEAAMRAFLRGNSSTDRDMTGNPLRPEALRWTARDPDLRLLVHDDLCHCGLLHHVLSRASLILCVRVRCGAAAGAAFPNWVAAVKALDAHAPAAAT
ncbi:Uncharacterized protein GBIM_20473 [Gryllus bimaculatus]|nr:Uncharacterized protein GBIM_20473 [Gryllus bimaculatus]